MNASYKPVKGMIGEQDLDNFNIITKKQILEKFHNSSISFTVSSRNILKDMSISDYLRLYYTYLPISKIESLFGFLEDFSPLYGGRGYQSVQKLNQQHIQDLYTNNISLSITLTNHHFDKESYEKTYHLLEKHHTHSNSIVCVNDALAQQLKEDFPLYHLKASLIKNLNTYQKISDALSLYDSVVVPMEMNNDDDFLDSLPEKKRIIIFGNAGCAFNCPSRICYRAISNKIANKSNSHGKCSKSISPREDLGILYFDVEKFYKMGFSNFKLIPDPTVRVVKKKVREKKFYYNIARKNKEICLLLSYPKSGRTWFRFLLANYLNLSYELGVDIDLNNFFSILPNDEISPRKGINRYKYFGDDRFPLLLATHDYVNKADFDQDYTIFLIRSVHDTLVSEYFQNVHRLKVFKGSISQFLRKKNGPISRYCRYMNYLSKNLKKNTLVLTYEKMHADIEQTFQESLTFLKIPVNVEAMRSSIELSQFNNMREIELEKGMAGVIPDNKQRTSFRVRQGSVGAYKDYISVDDTDFINNYCNSEFTHATKQLFKKYGINYNGHSQ